MNKQTKQSWQQNLKWTTNTNTKGNKRQIRRQNCDKQVNVPSKKRGTLQSTVRTSNSLLSNFTRNLLHQRQNTCYTQCHRWTPRRHHVSYSTRHAQTKRTIRILDLIRQRFCTTTDNRVKYLSEPSGPRVSDISGNILYTTLRSYYTRKHTTVSHINQFTFTTTYLTCRAVHNATFT